jgi:superfamily II DNA or RNA helicase
MEPGHVANFAEQLALNTIIEPVLQRSAAFSIHPNYEITLDDGSRRFLDFAVITDSSRIAIEIDGYSYHAGGVVSRRSFDDQLDRQNEIILKGWSILRFSFDQIKTSPEKCKDQLRRLIISDPVLHRNYSREVFEPSQMQMEALAALERTRQNSFTRGLIALPTGTGKTILSALDAKRVGGKILFIAHNNEIIRQAANAYSRLFPNAAVGFINSDHSDRAEHQEIVFANISTFRKVDIFSRFAPNHFAYVVLDEFHHGAAPSYAEILRYLKPTFMLGLTATPERTDRKDILEFLEGNLIYACSASQAITRGFLVPFTYFGLFDNIDYSQIQHNGYKYDVSDLEKALLIPSRDQAILQKYKELAREKRTIGFCVSIKHAERMADVFSAAELPSVAIHSMLSKEERGRRIALFETGKVQCAFVRDIFNEGVDFPETEALLFLRPTESKIVFVQQLGRGLRLSPKKNNVIVLDFIGNYVGSGEIPALLRQICSDGKDTERRAKPELIYDNGCKVFFSERTIENIAFPDFKTFDRSSLIERLVSVSVRLDRPLTPLDVFMELKGEFGGIIKSMGGYKKLAERLNSLDDSHPVLDPNMNFSVADSFEGDDSREYVESASDVIFDRVHRVYNLIHSDLELPNLERVEYVHIESIKIMNLLAPLCLLKSRISLYASEILAPASSDQLIPSARQKAFFQFIEKHSRNKNAVATARYLHGAFPQLALIESIANQPNISGSSLVALDKLLDFKMLRWIADLSQITSEDSIT